MTTKRTKRKNSPHRHAFKTIKKFALLYLAVKQLKVINTKRYFVRVKVKHTFVNSFFRSTKISDHIFSCACAKSVRPCEGGRRENEVLTDNYDKNNWSLVEKKNWVTEQLDYLLSCISFVTEKVCVKFASTWMLAKCEIINCYRGASEIDGS